MMTKINLLALFIFLINFSLGLTSQDKLNKCLQNYTISVQIFLVEENRYDADINIGGVPEGHFIAIISNYIPEGSETRELIVKLMKLPGSPEGNLNTNTGVYIKGENETEIKVTVEDSNGNEVAESYQAY